MKQTITIDQLNELSDKGKEKLREWWVPEKGDLFVAPNISEDLHHIYINNGNYPEEVFTFAQTLPLLNIGKLIQCLFDLRDDKRYKSVEIPSNFECGECGRGEINPKTWCDALWSACKEVLER